MHQISDKYVCHIAYNISIVKWLQQQEVWLIWIFDMEDGPGNIERFYKMGEAIEQVFIAIPVTKMT